MLMLSHQGHFSFLGLLVSSLVLDLSDSFVVTSFSKTYDNVHIHHHRMTPSIYSLGHRFPSFSNFPTMISLSSSSSQQSPQGKHKQQQPQQPQKGKGYQQIGAPINPNICSLTKTEILQHIKERTKARRNQNFQKADEILSMLKRDNVFVNDATKQWRADGRSFIDFTSPTSTSTSTSTGSNNQDHDNRQKYVEYTKARNSKSLSIRDEEYILNKLKERHDAKLNRDYDSADDILDELRFLKNVQVDDTKRTYRVVDPFKVEYTFGGKRVNNIHPDILHDIESKIKERANAKKRKEYDLADDLLKELTEKHGVRVDDVKKEWHFMRKKNSDLDGNSKLDPEEGKEKRIEEKSIGPNSRKRIDASISDWSIAENESENKDNNMVMPEGISLVDDKEMESPNNDDDESIPIPEGIVISDEEPNIQSPSRSEHDVTSTQTNFRDEMIAELESLTVPILKEKLREAGLPVSGRKLELIERLMEDIR